MRPIFRTAGRIGRVSVQYQTTVVQRPSLRAGRYGSEGVRRRAEALEISRSQIVAAAQTACPAADRQNMGVERYPPDHGKRPAAGVGPN